MNRARYHARREDFLDIPESEGIRGTYSRLTAAEIERIRTLYDALAELRRQRNALVRELNIDLSTFGKYGRREYGRKPRQPAARKADTIDWIAAHPHQPAE